LKKITRKKLVKDLDNIFSKYIRARDGKCIVCGTTVNLQNGHLFSRKAFSTRWSEINCSTQCRNCNYIHTFDFEPYRNAFVKKYGQEQYDKLYLKFKSPLKISNSELELMILYYKNKLKDLERNEKR